MAEPQLRLSAEVIDRFSVPLRRLKDELGKVKTPPGMRGMRTDLEASSKAMAGVKLAAGGISSALGLIGIGGLSASAALKGIIDAADGVAKRTVELRHLGREVGIATDQLRALQALGERHQIAPDAMLRSIEDFADRMVDVRRRAPDSALFSELLKVDPKFADQLARDTDQMTALGHALGFLGNIKNPMLQKRWADLFGLGEDTKLFDKDGGKGIAAELAQIEATQAKTSAQLEAAADRYEQAIAHFNESMDRFKTDVATPSLTIMAKVIDGATATSDMLSTFYRGEFEQSNMLLNTMREVKGIYDAMHDAPTTIPRALNSLVLSPDDQARLGQLQSNRDMLANRLSHMGDPNGEDAQAARRTLGELDAGIKTLRDKLVAPPATPTVPGAPATVQQQSWRPEHGLGGLVHLAAFEERRQGPAIGRAIAEGFVDYLRLMQASGKPGTGQGTGGGPLIREASYGGLPGGDGDAPGVRGGPGHRAARDAVRRGSGRRAAQDEPIPNLANDPLLNLILKSEGTAKLNYNDSFAHQLRGMDLTHKTIGEIRELQRSMHGSSAIGAFQFMRGTLGDLIDRGVVKSTDLFSPENQRRMAEAQIEKRLAQARRAGGGAAAQLKALAQEWASFPTASGQGYYPGQHAAVTPKAVLDALRERQEAINKHQDLTGERPAEKSPPRPLPDIGALAERGRRAGVGRQGEPTRHHVTGAATLDVRLRAPPGMVHGTSTRSEGFVREIRVNRGQSMGREPGEFGSA